MPGRLPQPVTEMPRAAAGLQRIDVADRIPGLTTGAVSSIVTAQETTKEEENNG